MSSFIRLAPFSRLARQALFARSTVVAPIAIQPAGNSHFSTSNSLLAKKGGNKGGKKNKKNKEEAEDIDEDVKEPEFEVDFPQAENKYKSILEAHKKRTAETRLGRANPNLFDSLKIEVDSGKAVPFTSIAQTSLKGRNLNITVFDPKDIKHVVSGILGAGLNMNPQIDATNGQLLKVPLPPPTSETKLEIVKQLKEDFEKFKNSHGHNNLSEVRSVFLKNVDRRKLSDREKKIYQEFENLHKKYTSLLEEQFKAAEKAVMK